MKQRPFRIPPAIRPSTAEHSNAIFSQRIFPKSKADLVVSLHCNGENITNATVRAEALGSNDVVGNATVVAGGNQEDLSSKGVTELLAEQQAIHSFADIHVLRSSAYLFGPPKRLDVIGGDYHNDRFPTKSQALPPLRSDNKVNISTLATLHLHDPRIVRIIDTAAKEIQDNPHDVSDAVTLVRKTLLNFLSSDDSKQRLNANVKPQGDIVGSGGRAISTELTMQASTRDERLSSIANAEVVLPFLPKVLLHNITPGDGSRHQMKSWSSPDSVAVMFADISGYSRMTNALLTSPAFHSSHGGGSAYALSSIVNGYFERIIDIVVHRFRGDIVKFAGDAILVVWAPTTSERINVESACMAAVLCAAALQEECGVHPVPEVAPDFELALHIGITCGSIHTEVYQNLSSKHMESSFHNVSGMPLSEIGHIVDAAMAKEVCVSSKVYEAIQREVGSYNLSIDFSPVVGDKGDVFKLGSISGSDVREATDRCVAEFCPNVVDLLSCPNDGAMSAVWLEAQDALSVHGSLFVHPQLLRRFASVTSSVVAEVRFLAVLFIGKSDEEASNQDWFAEVQSVLDAHRCPVVKIIDDDKGIHVIAAVGLFVAEPDASMTAVEAARDLLDREVGCVVGIASGPTFCGIIGSQRVACRWDVTGASCVRSCRLMQQAVARHVSCLVDESVFESIGNKSLLERMSTSLLLKGTDGAVTVFSICSGNRSQPSYMIRNIPWFHSEMCHHSQYQTLRDHFLTVKATGSRASAAVIEGGVGIGKVTLAVRVAETCHGAPIVHESGRTAFPLSITETLANWFIHSPNEQLRVLSTQALEAFRVQHISRSRRALKQLLQTALFSEGGSRMFLIVRQAQLLDETSLHFLSHMMQLATDEEKNCNAGGHLFVIFCVTPSFNTMKSCDIVQLLECNGSGDDKRCAQVVLSRLDYATAADVACKSFSWELHESVLRFIMEQSCGVPRFIHAMAKHIMAQRPYLTHMSDEGYVFLRRKGQSIARHWNWVGIAPQHLPTLLQIYDSAPTGAKTILRVMAALAPRLMDFLVVGLVQEVTWRIVKSMSMDEIREAMRSLVDIGIVSLEGCHDVQAAHESTLVSFSLVPLKDAVLQTLTIDFQRRMHHLAIEYLASGSSDTQIVGGTRDVLMFQSHSFLYLTDSNAADKPEKLNELSSLHERISKSFPELSASVIASLNCNAEDVLKLAPISAPDDASEISRRPMPMSIVHVKNYIPPIGLGKELGLSLFQLAWLVRQLFLHVTRLVCPPQDEASEALMSTIRAKELTHCCRELAGNLVVLIGDIQDLLAAAPTVVSNVATQQVKEPATTEVEPNTASQLQAICDAICDVALESSTCQATEAKDALAGKVAEIADSLLVWLNGPLMAMANVFVTTSRARVASLTLDTQTLKSTSATLRTIQQALKNQETTDVALLHICLMQLQLAPSAPITSESNVESNDLMKFPQKFSLEWVRDSILCCRRGETVQSFIASQLADFVHSQR